MSLAGWASPDFWSGPSRYGLTLDESALQSSPCGRTVHDYDWEPGDRGRIAIRTGRAWVELDAEFHGWSVGSPVFCVPQGEDGQYGVGLTRAGILNTLFGGYAPLEFKQPSGLECRVWFGGRWLPDSRVVFQPWGDMFEADFGYEYDDALVVTCGLAEPGSVLDEVLG